MGLEKASKALDEKVRALSEDFETRLGEAFNDVVERFHCRVESLIERYGTTAVGDRMKRCPISMPGGTLYSIFRPMVAHGDIAEETWAVDEEESGTSSTVPM